MTAKKVTQTTKKAENVKINAPAKTVETAKAETAVKAETEVKEAPKAEVKAEPAKAEAPKAEAKKAPAKRGPKPKTEAKKKEAVQNVYVQFAGKEISTTALTELVTEKWVALGHRASSIKSLDLYVKPEDSAAYYVINGKESGKIEL